MAAIDWTAHYAARADGMFAELKDLVEMESPSRDAEGIGRVAEWLGGEFSRAGASVEIVDGPNLVVRYGDGKRPVMLLGHMDTVWERGTIARLPWRVEDGRVYGPGVFDMKAGCLVVLEAVRGLAANGNRRPVTVVFNCDEEIGSQTSRGIISREALASRAVLVFEPSIPGGLAKTSRSGVASYRFRVHGRAAHAGVDPEKGVSAIGAAADLVTRLHALNDLADGLSVNVGTISGGTRTNVVAAEARFGVDVRFRRNDQAIRVDEAIRALRPSVPGATAEIDGGIDRGPLEPTPAVMELYEHAAAASRAAGFEMGHGHVGGVSDGNVTAALGVPTLDGLGPDGMGAHADHEQIVAEDLPRRPAMLARLLLDL